MQHRKLRSLVVYAALGLFATMFITGNAVAQDDQAAESEDILEEVIVTGSRIVRDGFSSSSPLAVFDETDITMSGNASIDEFLKNVPQFTGYQMGVSTNNGSTSGQKFIDMRGLQFNRTLVLVNSRRTIGDATGDGAVDINTIPEAMIKRVEVLTDGASSIYGSDALAGVVNFILHDDFEGLRITGSWGAGMEDWDAENTGISVLAGAASDSANIVFSMAYINQDELLQGDRAWAYDSLYPLLQDDGTFRSIGSGSSNSRKIRTGDPGNFIWDSSLGAARPFESGDVYNYGPVNAVTQPNERYQMATIGKIEITDNTRAYFEGFYTRRTSQQRLAPDASFAVDGAVDTPNNGAQWNDFVPANNPYNPFGSVNCSNTIDLCGIDVRINRRFEESGGRLFRQTNDNYRLVLGFAGEVMDKVTWDVSYTYAETELVDETRNYGRFDRWAVAVDPVACASNATCAAIGVLNPFGEFGSITPAQMAFLTTGSLKDLAGSTLQMFNMDFGGQMMEMAGGTAGWAAGYSHRREAGFYSPDEFLSEGLTTSGASDPLDGNFSVDEFYGEIYLPITDTFTVDASARLSDYDTLSDRSITYKIGVDWEVVDGLRLRSSYSTGFRAPNIAELNQQDAGDFPIATSPCEFGDRALAGGAISQTTWDNCQVAGFDTSDAGEYGFAWQSYYETSSTGDLEAEESDTFTIGVVWQPDFAEGLSISVDYWDITVENVIGTPRFNVLFHSCLASEGMTLSSCDTFDLYGINYFGFPGDAVAQFGNLGTLKTDGVDFVVTYDNEFSNGLGYNLGWDAVWQRNYTEDFDLGGELKLAGTADGFGVYPEWRMNFAFGLSGNDWTANWNIRWIDETTDLWRPAITTSDAVAESMTYHDLVASYFFKNTRITAGVNNVTDEDPPYFHSAFNANTEPGMYDVIGRRVFVSITVDF